MTTQEVLHMAKGLGFSHVGELNIQALHFLPEVREMCAADRCHSFGKCWTCPPGCGTLAEITAKAARYGRGVLVQSTGDMEDDFDVETMLGTEREQKTRFLSLVEAVRGVYPNCLPMAAGACSLCDPCTYPHAPCRQPQRAIPSMEAYGLLVSDVCQQSGLPYYYGKKTITYTSCLLIE